MKRIIATTAVTAIAVPTALLAAAPAQADGFDREKQGRCGGGVYELSVDREDGVYEISADLDRVAPGSSWRVVLKQDGKVIANVVRKADREGDLDVDRVRRDTRGTDTFAFTANRLNGAAKCGASVVA
ncbi:hypothetical protein GCM10023340_31740 [Nocardioides marinquilinus]|uniref:Uncharacterized protein n=1 Tax=Nocardioides marinquilinus TaxID=1210400 RepID=A0ABP9PV95_9ACTN